LDKTIGSSLYPSATFPRFAAMTGAMTLRLVGTIRGDLDPPFGARTCVRGMRAAPESSRQCASRSGEKCPRLSENVSSQSYELEASLLGSTNRTPFSASNRGWKGVVLSGDLEASVRFNESDDTDLSPMSPRSICSGIDSSVAGRPQGPRSHSSRRAEAGASVVLGL
jgi:hypothetical protein